MMRSGVKFCGVTQEADIIKAYEAGASAIGVVVRPDETLHERSEGSRSVSIERGCELARVTPPGLDVVVAANTDEPEAVTEIGMRIGPDRIQVPRIQDPDALEALAQRFRGGATAFLTPVVKIGEESDLQAGLDMIDACAPNVRVFHFDTAGSLPGGNGEPHDWNISRKLAERAHERGRFVVLSGGLDHDIVAEAIGIVRPSAGVDAESANRDADGVYDEGLMRLFVEQAMEAMRR